ncbi:MAG: hypothetical protein KJN97_07250 [Deltaproteobacteria bacterium]|nr:hypothetical protein [Deltaproteobacteria bacterium]
MTKGTFETNRLLAIAVAVGLGMGVGAAVQADRGKPRLIAYAKILEAPKIRPTSAAPSRHRKSRRGEFPSYAEAMLEPVYIGSAATTGNESQLSQTEVTNTINKHLDKMYTKCVEKELEHAKLGRVKIEIAVDRKGTVMGATVSPGSKEFQTCMVGIVQNIKFRSFGAPRMGVEYGFRLG